ncbi:hypothetical protein RLOatenuis_2320 [Rickettsiales bacterium]|nr:hypothetical protein RLOatenuis_2320 [Rickettsiales bacterium]
MHSEVSINSQKLAIKMLWIADFQLCKYTISKILKHKPDLLSLPTTALGQATLDALSAMNKKIFCTKYNPQY